MWSQCLCPVYVEDLREAAHLLLNHLHGILNCCGGERTHDGYVLSQAGLRSNLLPHSQKVHHNNLQYSKIFAILDLYFLEIFTADHAQSDQMHHHAIFH